MSVVVWCFGACRVARVCRVALLACVVCVRVCLDGWPRVPHLFFVGVLGIRLLICAVCLACGALDREVVYRVSRDVQPQASCRAVVAETV